jgi:hypothetical protein
MIHLPQICLNFLDFSTVWVTRKFCGEKGILEIVKGFLTHLSGLGSQGLGLIFGVFSPNLTRVYRSCTVVPRLLSDESPASMQDGG